MSLLSPQELHKHFEQAQRVQFGEVRYHTTFDPRTSRYKALETLMIQILGKIVRGNGMRDKVEGRESDRIRFHVGNIAMEWMPDKPKRRQYYRERQELKQTEQKYGRKT